MSRPEWDIALICAESGLPPKRLRNLLLCRNGTALRGLNVKKSPVSGEQWERILVAAEDFGAVTEIKDYTRAPVERLWNISQSGVDSLVSRVSMLLDILPDIVKKYSSDLSYRIGATIPDHLHDLNRFFCYFENTVLGLRRMIAQTESTLTILVPFMDSEGLSEIFPSLKRALQRKVKIEILTRELGAKGRNTNVLAELIRCTGKYFPGLQLFETVMANKAPISHAKVISKDGGNEIYIGSANLTATSMERTIEIGVFLKGDEARTVNGFLSAVKTLSRKRWP